MVDCRACLSGGDGTTGLLLCLGPYMIGGITIWGFGGQNGQWCHGEGLRNKLLWFQAHFSRSGCYGDCWLHSALRIHLCLFN